MGSFEKMGLCVGEVLRGLGLTCLKSSSVEKKNELYKS